MKKNEKIFVCDFETTVFKGQQYTEVWASGCAELYTDEVKIFHSIDEQFKYFFSLKQNITCYFHNLKFDGNFILYYLINTLKFNQAIDLDNENLDNSSFHSNTNMKNKTFKYSISNMGQWYSITIKKNNKTITIKDSLKLLPFSLEKIGESFQTKHKKLTMEYDGVRYAGCNITDDEKKYIENDVLVLKEAMEIMYSEGHTKLTIGACCIGEYKRILGNQKFDRLFPNLEDFQIDENIFNSKNADEYIRKSYRGGWCYLKKGKENKIIKNGNTYDVNSLYPSVMHSDSGNKYPVGEPTFWVGNFPSELDKNFHYYFVRIKCRFNIKHGYLPFIQKKNSYLYKFNENLETSDIFNKNDGKYYQYYTDLDGNIVSSRMELTLTCVDFELLKKHYELSELEIIDGCYFNSLIGIFDKYIDKYKEIKISSYGAVRELAKLFLNNLYGKMAAGNNSSFKVVKMKDDKVLGFFDISQFNKKVGYIPVGSAITSYARNFTISHAQKNFDNFIYSDTDSIHLEGDTVKGLKLHDTDFNCWCHESSWERGLFVRQKTYLEEIKTKNGVEIDIKCAGMPQKCKQLFKKSITRDINIDEHNQEEIEFLKTHRTIEDFKSGLIVPSKLVQKKIMGGVILHNTTYELRL